MSKTDKKIISMVLVLIIIISQFSMVFAETVDIEITKKSLEDYLLTFEGIDQNNDGKLEAYEYADIKNLDLYGIEDFTGIQYAKNLKSLKLFDCDLSVFDIGNFENLESLCLSNSRKNIVIGENNYFAGMKNLKSITINNQGLGTLDLSESTGLEYLWLTDFQVEECILPELTELRMLTIYNFLANNTNIDLSKCSRLKNIKVSYAMTPEGSKSAKVINYPENLIMGDWSYDFTGGASLFNCNLENEIVMQKGDVLELTSSRVGINIDIENTNIIRKVGNEQSDFEAGEEFPPFISIKAIETGKTKLHVTDVLGREHEINLTVEEKNNQSLENTETTAEILDYNTILKSNGELWRVNSQTTAERIDVNVKNYVSNVVYNVTNMVSFEYYNEVGYRTESILRNNGNLTIKYTLDQTAENSIHITDELNVGNVKEINKKSYLTTNGDLYDIDVNIITGKIKTKKVMSDVKKIVNDCIVKNDNTTWIQQFEDYEKIADFEIKDQSGNQIIDMNNTLWQSPYAMFDLNIGLNKVQENFEGFTKHFRLGMYTQVNSENVVSTWKNEDSIEILDKVVDFGVDDVYTGTDIMIREDGTIWLYSATKGLVKVTNSTVIENWDYNKLTEDEIYLRNTEMQSKKLGNKTGITGLVEAKTVKDFINENNFYLGYTVKVFNIKDEQLADHALIGTGDRIKLYNGDKVVKEYTAIIYGDTNGDGQIGTPDALGIVKNKTKEVEFSDIAYIEAGRIISKDGVPSAIDALAIVKHQTEPEKHAINQAK